MPLGRQLLLLPLMAVTACAETTAPLPPPVEAVVVVNGGSSSLSVVPVARPDQAYQLMLAASDTGARLAVLGGTALIVYPNLGRFEWLSLSARASLGDAALPPGFPASAGVLVNDSIGYLALPGRDVITRIHLPSGDTASVAVGHTPMGLLVTRGRVFAINANLAPCPTGLCPAGPSWLTVVDPVTNQRTGIDSIPLPGPGNARFGAVGGDGLLYVISVGGAGDEARLSLIDPVGRMELASFGGLGVATGPVAAGEDRLFISSSSGVLVFDLRSRRLIRGPADPVPTGPTAGVATSSTGRLYGVDPGPCNGSGAGRLLVFDSTFTARGSVPLAGCPGDAATTNFVPEG